MKDILILSENKHWKAELALLLGPEAKNHPFKWTFISNRTDTISELSIRYYDAIVLHSNLPVAHLEIIFKYLASTDYKDSPIFFITDHFEDFRAVIEQQHFSHLILLSAPVEAEVIAKEIIHRLFPKKTEGPADKNFKINLEFLKVFIDSTKYILKSFCQFQNVQHGKPYLYNEKNPPVLAIEGQIELSSTFFEGKFIIGFPKKVYLEILKLVLAQEDASISKENADFAGEIVNMVYGQAKNILNSSGHNFEKVIPTYEIDPPIHKTSNPIVIVPLVTDAGTIELLVEVGKLKSAPLE